MTPGVRDLGCARAMGSVHRRLDGDELDRASIAWLEGHLSDCPDCRAARDELAEIQRSLRDLPAIPLPDEALQRVWGRTVRDRRGGGWLDWRGAVAAALLAAVLGGLWYAGRPESVGAARVAPAPTEAELARAAVEARYVLRLASTALRRSERVAVGEVLGQHVAPALSKIPIEWPGPPASRGERGERGDDDA